MKFRIILLLVLFIVVSGCRHNNQIESWEGNYSFFESWPSLNEGINHFMSYSICIYEEDGKYCADMTIDGWMTLARYKALIQGDSQSIELIFDSYLPENMSVLYDKGDVILTFKKNENEILTYWGEYYPTLIENQESGKVYFVKDNIDD